MLINWMYFVMQENEKNKGTWIEKGKKGVGEGLFISLVEEEKEEKNFNLDQERKAQSSN